MKKWILTLMILAVVTALDCIVEGHAVFALAAVAVVALPIKNELAEKEMIKQFRHDGSWLEEVPSKNQWVNNDVIKIPVQGAAPKVLINNNIYPIVSNNREDGQVVLALNKYDTENTTVTDDELYALPYEKVSDVQLQHREELEDKTLEHALHAIAPDENSGATPVLETTGDADNGRKRLCSKDLITLKKQLDKLNVPKSGRVLVLSPDHVADLLIEDKGFATRYQNTSSGAIADNFYGFKTYEATYPPKYNAGLEKLPFESSDAGKDASVVFHKRSTAKARGSVIRYARDAKENPEYRESTIGFRLHFIGVAFRSEGIAAFVDGTV
ncbi:MAG: hypothetical protein M9958_03245 [Chitinophagales bacterium]|nr:hypothetical protein [Chitinophagales bacterium]